MLITRLRFEKYSKSGELLWKKEQICKSFLIQFLELLELRHSYTNNLIHDISNTQRNIDNTDNINLSIASSGGHGSKGASNNINYIIEGELIGIQVGTGTTAIVPDDYALETRIAHGQSSGKLEYGGCELLGLTFSNPNGEFTIRRYFTNNSGGSITIEEVGIYAIMIVGLTPKAACIAHDLTGGVAVADGEILKVTYVPQITV